MNTLKDERPLNYSTLKFCCNFFQEVVSYESFNKMTAYNVSITVSPNIFRPMIHQENELLNVGVYYDAMIRMIENYNLVFEGGDFDEGFFEKTRGGIGVIKNTT